MIKEETAVKLDELDYENGHSYTNYMIDYNNYFDNYLDFEDKENEKEIQYVENNVSSNDDKDYLLRAYLQDIKKIPLLTREEEIELAKKAKTGAFGIDQHAVTIEDHCTRHCELLPLSGGQGPGVRGGTPTELSSYSSAS